MLNLAHQTIFGGPSASKFNGLQRNSLRKRTGNYFTRTGDFHAGTGKNHCRTTFSVPTPHADPQTGRAEPARDPCIPACGESGESYTGDQRPNANRSLWRSPHTNVSYPRPASGIVRCPLRRYAHEKSSRIYCDRHRARCRNGCCCNRQPASSLRL